MDRSGDSSTAGNAANGFGGGAVVVTGAGGALGRAVVTRFREAGRVVVGLDRPGDHLDAIAGDGVHTVAVDLGDRAAVQTAFTAVDALGDQLGGGVGAVVALAGGFVPGKLDEVTEDVVSSLFGSNVDSVLWTVQAAAPRLAARGGGAVVTVGSKTALGGSAPVVHAASKAAVVRLTQVLADELRPQGIRVNAVLPSVIDTPANRSWMPADLAARAVAPAAIATVIEFLCGPGAAPISGAAIPVYGDA